MVSFRQVGERFNRQVMSLALDKVSNRQENTFIAKVKPLSGFASVDWVKSFEINAISHYMQLEQGLPPVQLDDPSMPCKRQWSQRRDALFQESGVAVVDTQESDSGLFHEP